MQVVIRSDQGNEIMCIKVYTVFLFMSHAFWNESIEDRVKLLESNVLCKIGQN